MSRSGTGTISKLIWTSIVACGALSPSACTREATAPGDSRPAARRVAGLIEITFYNVGSPSMTSRAIVASSVAELEAKRAAGSRARVDDLTPSFDLTVPANASGPTPPGPATVEVDLEAEGSATQSVGGTRYIRAIYRVRNAHGDGVAFDTPRRNLTFVPVSTTSTIGDTPVLRFLKDDGSPAEPALTRQLLPTGLVEITPELVVVPIDVDVLQVLTENELAPISLPPAVTNIFAYGFIVRKFESVTTRTLDPSPGPEQFDGRVTVAFRIPTQPNPADNPTTISVMMLALDHSETRLSQSLEEQTPAAADAIRDRAVALGASTVTVLPGGAVSGPFTVRRVCSVRTAGPPSSPTAFLVNVPSSFQSMTPDPYTAAGSAIPRTTNFRATFTGPITGANSMTYAVSGSASGAAYLGRTYTGNGTPIITTPTKTFFAGEEVGVTISSAISCPNGRIMRFRVASSRGQGNFFQTATLTARDSTSAVASADLDRNGTIDIVATNLRTNDISVFLGNGNMTFRTPQTFAVGRRPVALALGDFNSDGIFDVATANELDRTVSVLSGRGDGTFGAQRTFGVGTARSIAVTDVTNSGRRDIVVANAEATVSILLNDGQGGFRPQRILTASAGGKHTAIATGDLNRDGAADLVVTDSTSGSVSVWLGNGEGTFQPEGQVAVGAGPSSVGIGDFNGDGIPDLAVANQAANQGASTVATLLGTGAGTFQPARFFAVGNRPASLVVADFDGDGRLDVTTANLPDREASTLIGNGDGTFQGRRTFFIGESPRSIIAADFNNDGVIDLAVANGVQPGRVSVFQGRPS